MVQRTYDIITTKTEGTTGITTDKKMDITTKVQRIKRKIKRILQIQTGFTTDIKRNGITDIKRKIQRILQ